MYARFFQRLTRIDCLIIAAILLCAIFLSIKYYTGVENSPYYAGFILKSIHPDLLPNDPIIAADVSTSRTPYQLTIYYLFPKILGEIWLDDRFIAFLYVLLTALNFLAADRIAVALGASKLSERLIVLLVFLKDHKIFENEVNFAHHPDFHHSAWAFPIGLWLFWAVVRGKSLLWILVFSVLLVITSLQVAPYAIAMSLIAFVYSSQNRTEKRIASVLLIVGFITAIYVLFIHLQIPAADRSALWNILILEWYEGMATPFDPQYISLAFVLQGALVLGGVFMTVLYWPAEQTRALRATRAIIAVSFIAWIVVSLYSQFSPIWAQYPQTLIFPIARQLQTPQILAYIAAIVIVLRWAAQKQNIFRSSIAFAIISILVISGPGNHHLWIALFGASIIAGLVLYTFKALRIVSITIVPTEITKNFQPLYAFALCLTMGIAMGYATWQKYPDWRFLIKTGVHGASYNAVWVGVAEWIRANTPKDAVIFPLQYPRGVLLKPGQKHPGLIVYRSLASRGGRVIPIPMLLSQGLDLKHILSTRKQLQNIKDIAKSWVRGDAVMVMNNVQKLQPQPNYIIVPTPEVSQIVGPRFPFAIVIEINGFTILRRNNG